MLQTVYFSPSERALYLRRVFPLYVNLEVRCGFYVLTHVRRLTCVRRPKETYRKAYAVIGMAPHKGLIVLLS